MRTSIANLCAFLFLWLFFACQKESKVVTHTMALVGGTVLDFDNYGKSNNDIENAIVIISKDSILSIGNMDEVVIPKNAKVVDVSGKYLTPGFIDAFATLNDQNYANSFLYMGVTTIVGLEGGRRGKVFWEADPSPEIIKFDSYYGEGEWSDEEQRIVRWANKEEIEHAIDSLGSNGVKVLLVHYGVKPDQLPTIVQRCRENGIVTIGELGYSKAEEAINVGIQSFVHISRYSIDVVPEEIKKGYEDAPFGPPRIKAYEYYEDFDPEIDSAMQKHAAILGRSNAALIPTHSLWYPSFPFAKNPWKYPIAKLIEADSIHMPVNQETGKWGELKNTERWDTLVWSKKLVNNLLKIEKQYVRNGAKYLTGSGTDAFGTMPGISQHSEMEMLVRSGLTPREAIAAATTNFCKVWEWNYIGQIKEGSEADILLFDENPVETLENLNSLDLLVLDGKLLERNSLLKESN